MIVYPAIDIRDGKCVRLVEGDFDRETVFAEDPIEMARRWESAGAEWIHIVDLDGARDGRPVNSETARAIRSSVGCALQIGGGIRSTDTAAGYLNAGFNRVILGTVAIANHDLVANLTKNWPGRIAVGLDARDGNLAGKAWVDQTDVDAGTLAETLLKQGVESQIYTDISRDGTLNGPNLPEVERMVGIVGSGLIASGGVGNVEDVEHLRETGAGGVIIGRALYDGRLTLKEALAAAKPRLETI